MTRDLETLSEGEPNDQNDTANQRTQQQWTSYIKIMGL